MGWGVWLTEHGNNGRWLKGRDGAPKKFDDRINAIIQANEMRRMFRRYPTTGLHYKARELGATNRPSAAVAHIARTDGKLLAVWNKRYGRWAMPGGKVEDGEHPIDACLREVKEETGSDAIVEFLIYEGSHGESVESTRGSWVYVYECRLDIMSPAPCETEPGCPVTWFTREEFLKWGLAPTFYEKVFDTL